MPKLSDFVFDFLERKGIRHAFLVTGGGAMHLDESLGRSGITPICNSHEQASAICAEVYAKATGLPGLAVLTTGPGGTNAITGVAGAWLDSTPTIFLSGQVKRPDRMFDSAGKPLGMRQLGVQEVDIVSIVAPITKYAVTIIDPSSIRFHLEKAWHLATTGRPGPVWLDIPLDVQASPLDDPAALEGFAAPETQPAGAALQGQVRSVIGAWNKAERPLLFAGNGIRLARAEMEFEELRKLLKAPMAATWCAADLVPSDEPLFVGRPGSVAARGANFAVQNCDLLLAIGVRLDFAITGYAPHNLARGATKIAVDIDAAELAKLGDAIQLPICADSRDFLRELLRQKETLNAVAHPEWDARCAAWKTKYPVVTAAHRKPEGQVSIFHLAEVIGEESKATDALISGSSGAGIEIFLLACPTRNGQRIFHTAGLGSMGFGLPSAIAVSIARNHGETICVDGDGGFQFNIQELETVRRLNLPIKFFVLNNDGYASIRASQTNHFGHASIGCDERTGLTIPSLERLAAAYGLQFRAIISQANLREQVREVLDLDGPVLCDVQVIPDESREPRLSSKQLADGSFVSLPLEDLFPFLDREEFLSNMIVAPLPESLHHSEA